MEGGTGTIGRPFSVEGGAEVTFPTREDQAKVDSGCLIGLFLCSLSAASVIWLLWKVLT